MLYENIHLFQRTSLQMPKDRERIMCKLKIKRTVTLHCYTRMQNVQLCTD